jgi:hypothetical protein
MASRRRPLRPAAIDLGDGGGLFTPVLYVPTIEPDLIVAIVAGDPDEYHAACTDLSMPSTLPKQYRQMIHYPLGWEPQLLNMRAAMTVAVRLSRNENINVDWILNKIRERPQTFIHEYVHYWDKAHLGAPATLSQEYLDASTEDGTVGSAYDNDVLERNAFYHEMLSRIDQRPDEFFRVPFQQFWQRVQPLFAPKFVANLTTANRQRLIRRLSQLWASRSEQSAGHAARRPRMASPAIG